MSNEGQSNMTKPEGCAIAGGSAGASPFDWFAHMIENCLVYAREQRAAARPIVGIMCEFTPRELIMAAGGVPVLLCGGSAKTIPAAEHFLPSNLCPLIKSTFGFSVEKSNPFLEMSDLVVAETTCDGKKKMYELMAETRPMYVLELPQKPDSGDALEFWIAEIRKFKQELESRFRVQITEQALRDAIAVMNRERTLRRALAEIMKVDTPPMTGRQLLDLRSSISGNPADVAQYEAALGLLKHSANVTGRARDVRVLLTGVPIVHGDERVVDIIEQNGGLVVCLESCSGLKPLLDDVDETAADPIRAIGEKYFHLPCSVMTRNDARLNVLRDLASAYRADCVIELTWQACLTYAVEAHRVRNLVERDLGLPYLHIETDYSPSDSARMQVRVEALFETVRNHLARPAAPTLP